MNRIGTCIISTLNKMVRPIHVSPFLFCFVFVCSVAAPLSYSLFQHARIFHFILSSALRGCAAGYLLCLVLSCVPSGTWRKVVNVLFALPFALWTLLELGAISVVGNPIDIDSATVITETESSEINAFFSQYFSLHAFFKFITCIIIVAALTACGTWAIRRFSAHSRFRLTLAAAAITGTVGGCYEFCRLGNFITVDSLQKVYNWSGTGSTDNPMLINGNYIDYGSPILKISYIAKIVSLESEDMDDWKELQQKIWSEQVCETDSMTIDTDIVLIIGESFIRAHSSLYGYNLKTNPRLEAETDSCLLVAFDDVISPANFTTISLRNILNLNDISSGEKWSESPYLPLLMKKAGWNVYHYDNQTADRNSDVGISRMFYADVICDNVLDGKIDRTFPYDGQYVEHVDSMLRKNEKPGRNFVMYHLWGQHFDCKDRYEGTPVFKASDIKSVKPWIGDKEKQAIADYNNATLYNDSVVSRIIDRFRNRKAVVIYLSDHGEDSPELSPVRARNIQQPDDPEWLDRQFHIPFIVWMSPEFIKTYPSKADDIRRATHRRWSADNLGQMILGLTGIRTGYYNPRRDVLGNSFTPYVRTTASGYAYDEIRK